MQKKYIVLIAIFVIYLLIMVIFFGNVKIAVSNDSYFIIGNVSNWEYSEDSWIDLPITSDKTEDKLYYVYKDNSYKGEYYIENYRDTWYFFDENKKSHNLYGELFAYSGKESIEVVDFETEELSIGEASTILSKKYDIIVNSESELSQYQKVNFDFDGDGELEYIYCLSNLRAEDASDNLFAYVLYEDNGKLSKLFEQTGDDVKRIQRVVNIVDLNSDKKYEVILEHQKPLDPTLNCHTMHQLKRGKYEEIKSCK